MNNSLALLLVLSLLSLFNVKGQSFKVVTKDNDSLSCHVFEYKKVYKVHIKTAKILHNQRPYLAYLYQIDSNGIVVCNVNPKKIDTAKLNVVIFRKFYFKNITSLKINRDKNGLKGGLIVLCSGLISGIGTFQTGDGYFLSREDKTTYVASFTSGLLFYAVYLPMALPKKVKLNKNKIKYDHVLKQLVKRTKYKVY